MRRYWKTIAVVAGVAAIALSVVAVAYGAKTTTPRRTAGSGACGALMGNPQALQAMQELRVEHQKEMQAWAAQYGSGPSSAEARVALQKLRQEHWNDMQRLFKKLGIKAPANAGPGGGMMRGGGCGGACGGSGATGSRQGAGYGSGMMGSGSWN